MLIMFMFVLLCCVMACYVLCLVMFCYVMFMVMLYDVILCYITLHSLVEIPKGVKLSSNLIVIK